jgi:8-amino-7-oxononanoate synthase
MEDEFLSKRLQERLDLHLFRSLNIPRKGVIDFCSNDYLGIVRNSLLDGEENESNLRILKTGSTGSRLLSGNYQLVQDAETKIASFHDAQAALIFNSGYDANVGLLSCVAQRGDIILYDSLSHASIRDGIRLSFAHSFSFLHNNLEDLEKKLENPDHHGKNVFIVTESLFSMDGDFAPLNEIVRICRKYDAHLIVDEAHATGVVGENGEGVVQHLQLQRDCFARMHTFGKALGVHGAVILGSDRLRHYLVNFCRTFIYTTALPAKTIADILNAYTVFPQLKEERKMLNTLAEVFQTLSCKFQKLSSSSPIQGIIIPGNEEARAVAEIFQKKYFDIRPILYPSVPRGSERLRIILHAFNTVEQVIQLEELLG